MASERGQRRACPCPYEQTENKLVKWGHGRWRSKYHLESCRGQGGGHGMRSVSREGLLILNFKAGYTELSQSQVTLRRGRSSPSVTSNGARVLLEKQRAEEGSQRAGDWLLKGCRWVEHERLFCLTSPRSHACTYSETEKWGWRDARRYTSWAAFTGRNITNGEGSLQKHILPRTFASAAPSVWTALPVCLHIAGCFSTFSRELSCHSCRRPAPDHST